MIFSVDSLRVAKVDSMIKSFCSSVNRLEQFNAQQKILENTVETNLKIESLNEYLQAQPNIDAKLESIKNLIESFAGTNNSDFISDLSLNNFELFNYFGYGSIILFILILFIQSYKKYSERVWSNRNGEKDFYLRYRVLISYFSYPLKITRYRNCQNKKQYYEDLLNTRQDEVQSEQRNLYTNFKSESVLRLDSLKLKYSIKKDENPTGLLDYRRVSRYQGKKYLNNFLIFLVSVHESIRYKLEKIKFDHYTTKLNNNNFPDKQVENRRKFNAIKDKIDQIEKKNWINKNLFTEHLATFNFSLKEYISYIFYNHRVALFFFLIIPFAGLFIFKVGFLLGLLGFAITSFGAYYAFLAEYSSRNALEVAKNTLEEFGFFSEDFEAFNSKVSKVIYNLSKSNDRVCIKLLTAIPKFGNVGASTKGLSEKILSHLKEKENWHFHILTPQDEDVEKWLIDINSLIKQKAKDDVEVKAVAQKQLTQQNNFRQELINNSNSNVYQWKHSNKVPFQYFIIKTCSSLKDGVTNKEDFNEIDAEDGFTRKTFFLFSGKAILAPAFTHLKKEIKNGEVKMEKLIKIAKGFYSNEDHVNQYYESLFDSIVNSNKHCKKL